jgi:hypothetical protein
MVFTVNIKWLSFKQNISSLNLLLKDQISTYAILRYAHDIPTSAYKQSMNLLLANTDQLSYKKLKTLVEKYGKVNNVGIFMSDELEETIDVHVGFNPNSDIIIKDGVSMTMEF